VRRVLAERKAGDVRQRLARRLAARGEHGPDRRGDREDPRLADVGAADLLLGTLEDRARQREEERCVGALEDRACLGETLRDVAAHPRTLSALPRAEQGGQAAPSKSAVTSASTATAASAS